VPRNELDEACQCHVSTENTLENDTRNALKVLREMTHKRMKVWFSYESSYRHIKLLCLTCFYTIGTTVIAMSIVSADL